MIKEVECSSAYSWWFTADLDMTVLRGVVYKMKRRGPWTDPGTYETAYTSSPLIQYYQYTDRYIDRKLVDLDHHRFCCGHFATWHSAIIGIVSRWDTRYSIELRLSIIGIVSRWDTRGTLLYSCWYCWYLSAKSRDIQSMLYRQVY